MGYDRAWNDPQGLQGMFECPLFPKKTRVLRRGLGVQECQGIETTLWGLGSVRGVVGDDSMFHNGRVTFKECVIGFIHEVGNCA